MTLALLLFWLHFDFSGLVAEKYLPSLLSPCGIQDLKETGMGAFDNERGKILVKKMVSSWERRHRTLTPKWKSGIHLNYAHSTTGKTELLSK